MELSEYIEKYRNEIIGRVETSTRPLLPATSQPRPINALRKPYDAQHRVIDAAKLALDKQQSIFIIGEMGTGKTLIGALIPEPGTRTIILCPGHLTEKWAREINKTTPDATARILRTMSDCRNAVNTPTPDGHRDFFILSKETGKLGYLWRSIYENHETSKHGAGLVKHRSANIYDKQLNETVRVTRDFAVCPDCGKFIESTDSRGNKAPVTLAKLQRSKTKCSNSPKDIHYCEMPRFPDGTDAPNNQRGRKSNPKTHACNCALWTADRKRTRKIALAEYLKRLKAKFDYCILDEAHEFKSSDSAQANAFGTLASISEKKILLTGTLIGGYATHLYYLLWRVLPRTMKARGYKYGNAKSFIEKYGVTETVTRQYTGETTSNRRSKGSNKTSSSAERPGISPELFTDFLLGNGIFLQLDDLGADLPTLTETPISINFNEDQKTAYRRLESELKNAIAADLARGNKRLLGKLLINLLAYPDKPFELAPIDLNDGRYIYPRNLDAGQTFPKEDKLIELALDAHARGDKTLIYCQFTSSRDIQPRLQEKLEHAGLKTAILRSSIKPEQREQWIEDHSDIDCLICNPEIVKTGLDLYDYTCIVYFQTGYNIFTLRQASRRSWRLGQTKPVNIFYLYYADSMQHRAIDLIAKKLSAATALDGKLNADGLNALAEEDDALALARALIDGLKPAETIELPESPKHEQAPGPEMLPIVEKPEPIPDALNYDKLTGQDKGLAKFVENVNAMNRAALIPKPERPTIYDEIKRIEKLPEDEKQAAINKITADTPEQCRPIPELATCDIAPGPKTLTNNAQAIPPRIVERAPERVIETPKLISEKRANIENPTPEPPRAKKVKDIEYYRRLKESAIVAAKFTPKPIKRMPYAEQISLFG